MILKLINMTKHIFTPRLGQTDYTDIYYCPVINCVVKYQDKILVVERHKSLYFHPRFWNGISGFLDDGIGNRDFADIMEQAGHRQFLEIIGR